MIIYFFGKARELNQHPVELLETAYLWKYNKSVSLLEDVQTLEKTVQLPEYAAEYMKFLERKEAEEVEMQLHLLD